MVFFSVILAGVSTALFFSLFLHARQMKALRERAKARFFQNTPEGKKTSFLEHFPFIENSMRRAKTDRVMRRCEAELPRMLDILAMGMQAGLSFDAAFGIYVQRFDNDLAALCRERFEVWERGLISRSEGLEQLSAAVNLPLFDRFCRTASRSIRHGIPMAALIREYSEQARKEYRNKQKELVLKAPVKMLLPTGVLILPAMMLLVIGPIVLDVTGRMV